MPGNAPSLVSESLWQMPQASTLIRTWPAPGSGTSRCTSSKGPSAAATWIARIFIGVILQSWSQSARYPGQLQDAAGDFLDRTMRSIDVRHAKARIHAFGGSQFVLYLRCRGITAFGAAHLAYLLQAR